ncbi:MAG: hypothetical protein NC399_08350 [Muribaculum sp.]|nr:hypothetical protein [Muribaculum sp.]
MPDELYCYPDSNVLKNKMGIRDLERLHEMEGNGRSQREFIRCLALHNGYVINFVNAGRDEMLEASRKSFLCEYGAMERLFRKCLRKR